MDLREEMFEESGLVICPIAFPEYQYCDEDCENCDWHKEFVKGLENDKDK